MFPPNTNMEQIPLHMFERLKSAAIKNRDQYQASQQLQPETQIEEAAA